MALGKFIKSPNASVTDTEVGYLEGVTSDIQTQLDSKASLTGQTTLTIDTNTSRQTISQAYADTPGAGTAALPTDGGLSVTFTTTRANEIVEVNLIATVGLSSGADLFLAYKLDSDTPIVFGSYFVGGALTPDLPALWRDWITIPSAASHTIIITASRTTGSPFLYGHGEGNARQLKLTIKQSN